MLGAGGAMPGPFHVSQPGGVDVLGVDLRLVAVGAAVDAVGAAVEGMDVVLAGAGLDGVGRRRPAR